MKKLFQAVALFAALAMMFTGCATTAPAATATPAAATPAATTGAADATVAPSAEATASAAASTDANSVAAIQKRGTLIVATNAEFPPFESMEGDKYIGVDIELAQAIADKLGVKLQIENMAFDSVVASIPTGKADLAIAGLDATDERKQSVDFSDPYFSSTVVMLVKKDNDTLKTADDLKGKKLGVQLGTSADVLVASSIKDAEVVRMNKDTDSVQDLINGKLDAALLDISPAKVYAEQNADKIKLVDASLSSAPYAIAAKKGNTELLTVVNGVIKELQDSGKFDEILKKFKLK